MGRIFSKEKETRRGEIEGVSLKTIVKDG